MLLKRIEDKYNSLVEENTSRIKNEISNQKETLDDSKKNEYLERNKKVSNILLVGGILFFLIGVLTIILMCFEKELRAGDALGVFIFLAMITLIGGICCIAYSIKRRKWSSDTVIEYFIKAEKKEATVDFHLIAEEQVIKDFCLESNFVVSNFVKIVCADKGHKYLVIDANAELFRLIDIENNFDNVAPFNSLVSYEFFEDGKQVVKGKTGDVLVGGLLFGITGMLVAQNGAREIQKPITSLKLIIRINDFSNPQWTIDFINNNLVFNQNNYETQLQEIYNSLRLIYSNLEIIKCKKAELDKPVIQSESTNTKSKKEQLMELKELLDAGLITDSDYEEKKHKILEL